MIICSPDTGIFLRQVSFFATHSGNKRWAGDYVLTMNELKEYWTNQITFLPHEADKTVREFVSDVKYWCADPHQGNRLHRRDDKRTMPVFKELLCDRLWLVYRRDPHMYNVYNKRGKRILRERGEE